MGVFLLGSLAAGRGYRLLVKISGFGQGLFQEQGVSLRCNIGANLQHQQRNQYFIDVIPMKNGVPRFYLLEIDIQTSFLEDRRRKDSDLNRIF
jgi:hypothetical protein